MSPASPLRPAILLLGALLAAGCGFRLRGEATLPAGFERLWLEAPPESRIAEPLARALERAGARRVERREDAAVLLVVHADELRTEVLSIGGGARIREFRIRRRVELEARSRRRHAACCRGRRSSSAATTTSTSAAPSARSSRPSSSARSSSATCWPRSCAGSSRAARR
ncbi:MAG: hypothetical protein RML12_04355 [Xanthomonadales bacterium]|nr:hypothetical protein [Xanthomonadales bacterium]